MIKNVIFNFKCNIQNVLKTMQEFTSLGSLHQNLFLYQSPYICICHQKIKTNEKTRKYNSTNWRKKGKYHIHDILETKACKFPSKFWRYEKRNQESPSILWRIAQRDSGFYFLILCPVLRIDVWRLCSACGCNSLVLLHSFLFSRCFALSARSSFNLRFRAVGFSIASIFASASWNSNQSCVLKVGFGDRRSVFCRCVFLIWSMAASTHSPDKRSKPP